MLQKGLKLEIQAWGRDIPQSIEGTLGASMMGNFWIYLHILVIYGYFCDYFSTMYKTVTDKKSYPKLR